MFKFEFPKTIKRNFDRGNVLLLGIGNTECSLLTFVWEHFNQYAVGGQMSLAIPKDFKGSLADNFELGAGSLAIKKSPYVDEDFTETFVNSKDIQLIWKETEEAFNLSLYRPVLRLLYPKTCLSYHKDDSPFRLHFVLATHDNAMFIVDNVVEKMPVKNGVYLLRTDKKHTAINADLVKPRLHLTFSGHFKN